jgi:hypothetical protein
MDDNGKPVRPASISIKPKKTKEPAPGSYNYPEAFAYSYIPKKEFMIPKTKTNNYIGKFIKFYLYLNWYRLSC